MRLLNRFRYRKQDRPGERLVGFVILLNNEIHNFIRNLQVTKIAPCESDFGIAETPHITVKQGFHVDGVEPYEQYFDKLAAQIEPFEISVKGIGFFDQGVVFLDVEQDVRLENLRTQVIGDLGRQFNVVPNEFEDDRYHFHATMAYGLKDEALKTAREVLEDVEVDFRFVFDTLGIFYYTSDGWIVYKRIAVPQRSGGE